MRRLIVMGAIIAIATVGANAALVAIAIEGVVDSVEDGGPLEGKVKAGDIISGYYIYDTSTPDSYSWDVHHGAYWHYNAPCGIFLTIGDLSFQTDLSDSKFLMEIIDRTPPPISFLSPGTGYWLSSYNNIALPSGTAVDRIGWALSDGGYYSVGKTLTELAPTIYANESEYNDLWISGPDFNISGHITSAVVVPEPASAILFGLALAVLRRRQSRS